jgi:transcriptional regulator NrdR family protein
MMTCRICGGEVRGTGTQSEGGKVYRERKCLGCGRRFYTEENECREAWRKYNELHTEYNTRNNAKWKKKRAEK